MSGLGLAGYVESTILEASWETEGKTDYNAVSCANNPCFSEILTLVLECSRMHATPEHVIDWCGCRGR